MFPYSMLQTSDIDSLGDGVFGVLDRVGVLCQNQEILEALQQAGARVDFERETAAFPRRMCQMFLDRSGWNGSDTDAVVLSRMQDQVHGCLSTYQKPAVDPDQLEKMRNVVACAQNALLS